MTKKFVFWSLQISSYSGIIPGAIHWYAWIKTNDRKEYSLSREMTSKEVKEEIKAARELGLLSYEMEVHRTHKFNDLEEVDRAAREEFQRRAPKKGGVILVQGNPAVCDPRPILVAPPGILEKGNEIFERWTAIGGWDQNAHYEQAEAISKEWDEFIQKVEDEGRA